MWQSILDFITRLFATVERTSPQDVIPRDNIKASGTAVTIDYSVSHIPFTKPPFIIIGSLADTNSMDPGMDAEHNTILIYPADSENHAILCDWLKPGDIAIWKRDADTRVIHRIIKITTENGKRRFYFKGDNNGSADSYIINDEHIICLCAGTIY